MKEPEEIDRVLKILMAVIISIVASVGTIAYAGYGSQIQDMVTLNLPHNGTTMFARLMYSVGLLCSYPLQAMPAFEISEKT
jgi:amino acid permease